MSVGELIKIALLLFTALTGLVSIFAPDVAGRFVGFYNLTPRGRSEVRTVLGGVFLGLAIAPLALGRAQVAYQVVGFAYLVGALVRTASIVSLDRDTSRSSLISVAFEWAAAILLIALPN
jgi:hypothetical protein